MKRWVVLVAVFSMVSVIISSVVCSQNVYAASNQQLKGDLNRAYENYTSDMTELQKTTQADVTTQFQSFKTKSNQILESNSITSFALAYAKLRASYYKSLFTLVRERIPLADKIYNQFMSDTRVIINNYKSYGMSKRAVTAKVNTYKKKVNINTDKKKINDSISKTKKAITDTVAMNLKKVKSTVSN